MNPKDLEVLKQMVERIFKENDLSIKVEAIGKIVNLNLDLATNIYNPYMKADNIPTYVYSESNHPRGILENIPKSVNKRLIKISANEEVFQAAITL